jgi:hypothetical protein
MKVGPLSKPKYVKISELQKTELWTAYRGHWDSTLSSLICSSEPNEISKVQPKELRVVFITVLYAGKVSVLSVDRKMNLF